VPSSDNSSLSRTVLSRRLRYPLNKSHLIARLYVFIVIVRISRARYALPVASLERRLFISEPSLRFSSDASGEITDR